MSILLEINHDLLRARFNRYTRKAFRLLPKLDKPLILDIGCGTGEPILELTQLSDGQIIGIDIDQNALDRLSEKIKKANLTERVKTIKCSMTNMTFPDKSFDIIWAEGTIFIIGFQKGLKEWRQFLKPAGFLVVHDEMSDIQKRLSLIPICDYKLVDYFIISKDVWWDEYYFPLEKKIKELRIKYGDNIEVQNILDKEQSYVDEFNRNPRYHGSVFYIMQKRQ
jgi:ubiquinone/menaquinone biosynthesis C-methylase UbiE